MTVEITRRRITAIYPSATRRAVADSIVDVSGKYVIPGLFDSHVHLTMSGTLAPPLQLKLVLEGGVTSVREMAGLVPALRQLAPVSQLDTTLMPRVYYAAFAAGPTWFADPRAARWTAEYPLGTAPWLRAVSDTSDIAVIVANAKATGATGLKIYADLQPALVRRVADEARRQGMRVWAHSTIFPASPFDVVEARVHSVSHATYAVWAETDSLPGMSRGTLNASKFSGDPATSHRVDSLLRRMRATATMLDATLSLLSVRQDTRGALGKDADRTVAWTRAFVRRAHAMGVQMVAGTDAMGPGRDSIPIVHYELEELVKHGGLTPAEAIAAATRNAAEVLGVDSDYGTVAVGKIADLLVLSGDPTADVRNTRRPLIVFKGGRAIFHRIVR